MAVLRKPRGLSQQMQVRRETIPEVPCELLDPVDRVSQNTAQSFLIIQDKILQLLKVVMAIILSLDALITRKAVEMQCSYTKATYQQCLLVAGYCIGETTS